MAQTVFPVPSSGRIGQPFSQLITASTNWTCPAGVTRVKATIASGGSTNGGPGGYLNTTVPVTPGTSYPIVVGAVNGDTTAFTLKASRNGVNTPDTGYAADMAIPGGIAFPGPGFGFPSNTNGNTMTGWRSATFFNNRYYMLNWGGSAWAIHTSTNGTTWTNNAITGGWNYRGIASNSTHVAYFSDGDKRLYYSSDGTTFSSQLWSDTNSFMYFAYINGLWIVGGYNKIWWSSDVTLPQASWSTATLTLNDTVASVSFGNGQWAVCKQYASNSNVIGLRATSLSGPWSNIDVGAPYMWGQSLTFNGGRFLLVNGPQPGYQGRCWSSTDLVNWSQSYYSTELGATSGSEIFTAPAGNGIVICGYWNQNLYYWDGVSAPVNVGLRQNTVALPYGNANGRVYTFQSGTTTTGIYHEFGSGNPKIAGWNSTPVTASGVGSAFKYQTNTSGGGIGYMPGDGIDGWCAGTAASWGSPTRQGAVLLEWWA